MARDLETDQQSPPTPTCKAHCRTCGRHFSGVDAFDAHRFGDHAAPPNSLTGRHCRDPEPITNKAGESRYGVEYGVCRISDPDAPENDAAIWFLAKERAKIQEHYQRA